MGLGVFLLLHMGNHAMLLVGVEAHLAVQEALRRVYRHPLVEPILLVAVAVQIGLGARMIWQRGWPRRGWARLQVLSGGVLGVFLLQHVTAALLTRWMKPDIETNVYWAASVVSRPAFATYFAPYYMLGVAAMFAHVASFLALRRRQPKIARGLVVFGAGYAIVIVLALMGVFGAIPLPPAYETYLDNFWF